MHKDVIPHSMRNNIRVNGRDQSICDAGTHLIEVHGTIDLTVELGTRLEVVKFNVFERLSTEAILGCDFCDKHVEEIRTHQRLVELDNCTAAPNIRHPFERKKNSAPLPEKQEFQKFRGCSTAKVVTSEYTHYSTRIEKQGKA